MKRIAWRQKTERAGVPYRRGKLRWRDASAFFVRIVCLQGFLRFQQQASSAGVPEEVNG